MITGFGRTGLGCPIRVHKVEIEVGTEGGRHGNIDGAGFGNEECIVVPTVTDSLVQVTGSASRKGDAGSGLRGITGIASRVHIVLEYGVK